MNLRVMQRSREGLERITLELEEREKMQEELQAVWVWLTAADGLLSEIDLSGSTAQPQVRPPCGSASEQIRCGQGLQSLESGALWRALRLPCFQAIRSQWCVHQALVRGIRERLKSKYSEGNAVPPEIDGRLQEVQKALEKVGAKVNKQLTRVHFQSSG